jgi:hypothetical protein
MEGPDERKRAGLPRLPAWLRVPLDLAAVFPALVLATVAALLALAALGAREGLEELARERDASRLAAVWPLLAAIFWLALPGTALVTAAFWCWVDRRPLTAFGFHPSRGALAEVAVGLLLGAGVLGTAALLGTAGGWYRIGPAEAAAGAAGILAASLLSSFRRRSSRRSSSGVRGC